MVLKKSFFKFITKLYNSPTFTTFGSYATRTLSLLIVLPLILSRFSAEEIALWYLFSIYIGFQILIDMGFGPTFTRVIAYSMGGATQIKDFRSHSNSKRLSHPNWQYLEAIWKTMRSIYRRLSLLAFLLYASIGTWSLVKPLQSLPNQKYGWLSWIIIVFVSSISVWNGGYVSMLQGMTKVALQKRWETIISLASIMASFLVLFLGGKLLELVMVNQICVLINVIWNRYLCQRSEIRLFTIWKDIKISDEIFKSVWPSVWRSGLGIFMSYGLVQSTGLIYAQFGTAASVSSYLLGLRFIQMIGLFSQSPFYSRLPMLAKLRSEENRTEQIKVAQRGMKLAYWIYVVGFIFIGVLAEPVLTHIGSHAQFVDQLLWSLMGVCFFLERYGAMHIQLYSTTNHIIWHVANGISGIINILIVLITYNLIGVYAFPIGILSGYIGFYCWYSAMHSYREFSTGFWKFESRTSILPFIVMITYIVIVIIFN